GSNLDGGARSSSSSMAAKAPWGGWGTGWMLSGLEVPVCTPQAPWLLLWSKVCQPDRLPVSPLRSAVSKVPLRIRLLLTTVLWRLKVVTWRKGLLTTARVLGTVLVVPEPPAR